MIGSASFVSVSGTGHPPFAKPQEAGDSEQAVGPGHSGRILIVEDDYMVALSNEWALTDAGFEVVATVATGEEALVTAAQARPDLVLMDIRLAGRMDGIDAALALRVQSIPCLFASANSDPGTMARGEAAEPLDWIRKPFTEEALVAAVRKALGRLRGS
jgi:two-component system, response regulator PdtaR